jgi:hypothetical protein
VRRDLDALRVAAAILELLHLLEQLLPTLAQGLELTLLPVQHVAELLDRALEVRDLELESV